MPWLTPASFTADRATYVIDLPDEHEWRRSFKGALMELTFDANWLATTGLAADEVAEVWRDVYGSIRKAHVLIAGDIVQSAAAPPLANRLLCDGGVYDVEDYPELFEAIGYTFGGSGSAFNVPNAIGRAIVCAGTTGGLTSRGVGEVGGHERTTILEANLPAHSHTTHSHLPGMAQLGVGEPVSLPAIANENTGSTGDGDPLDIMPPFLTMYTYIVCR